MCRYDHDKEPQVLKPIVNRYGVNVKISNFVDSHTRIPCVHKQSKCSSRYELMSIWNVSEYYCSIPNQLGLIENFKIIQ